jgi:hypothetical protein
MAQDRRQEAIKKSTHWLDEDELHRRRRYWNGIIRQVERETGRRRRRASLRNLEER